MSTHIKWETATHVEVEILAGDDIQGLRQHGGVREGKFGLAIGPLVIEGTMVEIEVLARTIGAVVWNARQKDFES